MEVLNIIRNSPELMKMVDGINYENEKPRGKRRSKESLAVDKFWFGADRANFYLLLKKTGYTARRCVKAAILILVCERSLQWKDK